MSLDPSAPEVNVVYLTLYKNFMEAIDAIDNGVNQWDGDAPPKYSNNTHLSARVGSLNPSWNTTLFWTNCVKKKVPPKKNMKVKKFAIVNSHSLMVV